MAMILDIDAFNHNHSNDGLASMANQPKANTSDSNQQFLSYYGDYTIKMSCCSRVQLYGGSRVKLTCLTTV